MVEGIEELAPELDGLCLARVEATRERQVENNISGSGNHVASRVAECIGRRLAERSGVEPVLRRALIVRQRNFLAGHDIGPVESAGVGVLCCEVEGVLRGAVLGSDDAAGYPATQ